jgi:predicted amidophosphoribosyltransferase
MNEQIYITRGEVATLETELRPQVTTRLRLGTGVTCPSCGAINREGRKFCAECGEKLLRPSAGADLGSGQASRSPEANRGGEARRHECAFDRRSGIHI